jgi:hypothetical protein
MDLELTGTVADFRSPEYLADYRGTVDIPSLSVWSSVLNLPSELSGPFTGTVSLTGEGTGADLVVSSQSDLFSLDIGGRLEPGESMLGSTMRLQGEIIRPGRFLSLFMEDAPGATARRLRGSICHRKCRHSAAEWPTGIDGRRCRHSQWDRGLGTPKNMRHPSRCP